MAPNDVVAVPASLPVKQLVLQYFLGPAPQRHRAYPVVDAENRLLGVVTTGDLLEEWMVNLLSAAEAEPDRANPIIAFDLVTRAGDRVS